MFDPGVNLTESARFGFELTGVVAGSYDIVAGGCVKAVMEPAGGQRPDTIFGCETQTFVLLVYGRIAMEDALAGGQVTASGDTELAARFGR